VGQGEAGAELVVQQLRLPRVLVGLLVGRRSAWPAP
jgi:ABC-type enterobactin transport system permease subunit